MRRGTRRRGREQQTRGRGGWGRPAASEQWGNGVVAAPPGDKRTRVTHGAKRRLRVQHAGREGCAGDAWEEVACRDVPHSKGMRRDRRHGRDALPIAADAEGGDARLSERRGEGEARDGRLGADAVEQHGRVRAPRRQSDQAVKKWTPWMTHAGLRSDNHNTHRAEALVAKAAIPAPPPLVLYIRLCFPVERDWSCTAFPLGNATTSCKVWHDAVCSKQAVGTRALAQARTPGATGRYGECSDRPTSSTACTPHGTASADCTIARKLMTQVCCSALGHP